MTQILHTLRQFLFPGAAGLSRTSLSETAQYSYIPGLDGLRAGAVLIVLVAHFGLSHIVPGGFGVTLFFFISGFLITRLLIAEHEKKGRVQLKNFYLRRLVRLYPALLFMIIGTTLLYGGFGYGGPAKMELLAAVGYFTNIFHVSHDISGAAAPFMPWKPLWSLAVEEHFYLLFPLVVLILGRKHIRLVTAVIAVVVLVPIWRLALVNFASFDVGEYTYMMTDARIDSIAWGCLLSVLLHQLRDVAKLKYLIGFIPLALAAAALLFTFVFRDETFRNVWRYSVQGGAIFVLILNLYYFRPVKFAFNILEFRPLAWVGKTSYALYLWHFPVLDLMERQFGQSLNTSILAFELSLIMAAISFYIVETPFLKLRKRLGSFIPKKGGAPVAASGLTGPDIEARLGIKVARPAK